MRSPSSGSPFGRRVKRLLPLPIALWHATVGKRALKGIAKGDDVLVYGTLARRFYRSGVGAPSVTVVATASEAPAGGGSPRSVAVKSLRSRRRFPSAFLGFLPSPPGYVDDPWSERVEARTAGVWRSSKATKTLEAELHWRLQAWRSRASRSNKDQLARRTKPPRYPVGPAPAIA